MTVRSLDRFLPAGAILMIMKSPQADYATKKDIKDVRADLKQTEKSLRAEILRVEEKVENLEDGQKDIKQHLNVFENTIETRLTAIEQKLDAKFDKVMTVLDKFVETVDDLRTDNTVGAEQIRDLDIRVTKLESPTHA